MSSLGENVRNYRRLKGWTQEQLAEAVGASVGTVRIVEQGGTASVEILNSFARALDTTTSSLFATEVPSPIDVDSSEGPRLMELRRALTSRSSPVGKRGPYIRPSSRTP